ncbi:MAG: YggT family protein [Alphaproteobacteria bacterium]
MNLNPFLDLILTVLNLYKLALSVWIILSWLIAFNIVNRYQPFVQKLSYVLDRLIEPALAVIRRYIPSVGGVDLSSIILFLLIGFFKSFLLTYLYS